MIFSDTDIDLLYIEDNEDFIEFVGSAVKKVDSNIQYEYVTDGAEAKMLFDATGSGSQRMKSAKVILLDYNLPGLSGMQLLQHIRSVNGMKYTPVVIFSTSDNPQDIKAAYSFGANAYLVKPDGISELKETIQIVCDFWIKNNQRVE